MDITGIVTVTAHILTDTNINCIEGKIVCVRILLHGNLRSDLRQKSIKQRQRVRKKAIKYLT